MHGNDLAGKDIHDEHEKSGFKWKIIKKLVSDKNIMSSFKFEVEQTELVTITTTPSCRHSCMKIISNNIRVINHDRKNNNNSFVKDRFLWKSNIGIRNYNYNNNIAWN